ncbi:MAG: ABC transporter permease subunit [Zoogloeaceae bacterium]|jgi:dipeptide transport system permease protein|nr:ABC transporter permease subunit [Zoogloeaceae bacterium]
MFAFLLGRLGMLLPTLFGLTLLTFFLVRLLPGDPVSSMLGIMAADTTLRDALTAQMGLDRPLPLQYVRYLAALSQGDLGQSIATGEPVLAAFFQRFPATLELTLAAMGLALLAGIPLGTLAAARRDSLIDRGIMALALTGYSMPIYWWGLLAILFFSVGLGEIAPAWALPVSGRIAVEFDPDPLTGFMLVDSFLSEETGALRSALEHLLLPSLVLGTLPLAVIARMTRSSVLEIMREDYVRAARAKGLSPARVLVAHVLRNALTPIVTVAGLLVSVLLGGAVLTETIFAWPGIGRWMIEAVWQRDYPVLQGGLLLIALLVILVNFLVDVLHGVLNPRIRHGT